MSTINVIGGSRRRGQSSVTAREIGAASDLVQFCE
jgi:hypothetical protein